MKRRYIALGLMALLALVLLTALAGPASAKAVKIPYVTTSTPLLGPEPIYIGHGQWIAQYRQRVVEADDVSDWPGMTGHRTLIESISLNFNTMKGVGHGTYTVTNENGGVWEGTYTETFDLTNLFVTGEIDITGHGEAHGVAGDVIGLKATWTSEGGGLLGVPGGIVITETGIVH